MVKCSPDDASDQPFVILANINIEEYDLTRYRNAQETLNTDVKTDRWDSFRLKTNTFYLVSLNIQVQCIAKYLIDHVCYHIAYFWILCTVCFLNVTCRVTT